jgi:hypothetical protein
MSYKYEQLDPVTNIKTSRHAVKRLKKQKTRSQRNKNRRIVIAVLQNDQNRIDRNEGESLCQGHYW